MKNKNDDNHKNEVQDVRCSDEYWVEISCKYYRISYYIKINLQRIIIPKFMMLSKLFHVKNVIMYNCKKLICLKWTYGHFGHNYIVATLSTFYPTYNQLYQESSNRVWNR